MLGIFFLHLLSVWFLLGSLLVGIVEVTKSNLNWKEAKSIRYLPIIMALVMNLGVPPLLFLQVVYSPFFFSSSILLAVPWLLVFFLLLLSYGMIYATKYAAKEKWQAILFMTISAVSALWIAFTFSNNVSLMIRPDYWQQVYSYKQNGLNLYPNLHEVIARWVWVISPIFVAGAALLGRSRTWLLPSTVLSVVGLLEYKKFLPANVLAHPLVNVGIVADLILIAVLFAIYFIPHKVSGFSRGVNKKVLHIWLVLKAITVLAIRHGIRSGMLDPVYPLANLPVTAQPVLLGIFIVALIVGFSAVSWMLIKGGKELSV
jgi:hypothetical protein